jgi:DNA polymerase
VSFLTSIFNNREELIVKKRDSYAHALFPEMSWFPSSFSNQKNHLLVKEEIEDNINIVKSSQIGPCEWCDSQYPFLNGAIQNNNLAKSENIDVIFVGEPSKDELIDDGTPSEMRESETDLLSKMIKSMNLNQQSVARGFLVKCAGDKDSRSLSTCLSNFWRSIYTFKPRVIITLGAVTTNILLKKQERISKIHGRFFTETVKSINGDSFDTQIVPIFHPNYLLINPDMKRSVWTDLQKVMVYLSKENKNSP